MTNKIVDVVLWIVVALVFAGAILSVFQGNAKMEAQYHEVPPYCYDDGTELYFPCKYVKHPEIEV